MAEYEIELARSIDGKLVRFVNEQDGGPVHRVDAISPDGMVWLDDMEGWFASHLFVVADDIVDRPLGGLVPGDKRMADLETALRDLLEVSFPGVGADPDTEKYLRQKYDEAVERAKRLLGIKD